MRDQPAQHITSAREYPRRATWALVSLATIWAVVTTFESPRAAPPGPVAAAATQQSCTIADSELWADRPIDSSSCGLDGTGDAAHQAQNRAKNELCAGAFLSTSPSVVPARVTQFSFRRLQDEANEIRDELSLGARTVPPDRTRFQETVHTTSFGDDLGEGTLVRYVGFLLEGHFTGAEGVNCGRTKQVNFDIHMAFVEQRPPGSPTTAQAETLECNSITAEIIPRQRPEPWDLLGRLGKKSGGLAGAQTKVAAHDLNRPLRITGQLFFDGSHEACRAGKRVGGQPARVSNWEIHPVYAVDVCTLNSMASCRVDRKEVWKPLHEKLAEEVEEPEQ